MRKFLPFILIVFILAAAFSPVSLRKNGSLTINQTLAQNNSNEQFTDITQDTLSVENEVTGLGCNILTNWMGCIATLLYYLVFKTTSAIAYVAAAILDTLLWFSLTTKTYTIAFITEGWAIIRDISNLFFIFILLYIAIKTILNLGGGEAKKLIVEVVIIALLINFSLFFTRVVVDSSNILARVFYNNIETDQGAQKIQGSQGGIPQAILTQLNPQRLLAQKTWEQQAPTSGSGTTFLVGAGVAVVAGLVLAPFTGGLSLATIGLAAAAGTVGGGTYSFFTGGDDAKAGAYMLVILLASAANIAIIYTFFSVAFLFVARIIGLSLVMIFAPFAFVSRLIAWNKIKGLEYIGWSDWIEKLISFSFMAPIFVFFLYLILKFLKLKSLIPIEDIINNPLTDPFTRVAMILIPFLFIIGLILTARKITKDFAGKLGQQVNAAASTIAGAAGGALLGATALAGRATLGRLATRAATMEVGGGGAGAAGAEGMTRVPIKTTPPTTPQRLLGPAAGPQPGQRLLGPAGSAGGGLPGGPEPFARAQLGPTPESPGKQTEVQKLIAESKTGAGPEAAAQLFKPPEVTEEEKARAKINEEVENRKIAFYEKRAAKREAAGDIAGAKKDREQVKMSKGESVGTEHEKAMEAAKAEKGMTGAGLQTTPKVPGKPPTPPAGGVPTPATQPPAPAPTPQPQPKQPQPPKPEEPAGEGMTGAGMGATPGFKGKRTLKDMAAEAPQSLIAAFKSKKGMQDIAGKQAFKMFNYLGKSSFDFRDTKLMKLIGKQTGLDFGKAGGKGGWDQMMKDYEKKQLAFAETLEASGSELKKVQEAEAQYGDLQAKITKEMQRTGSAASQADVDQLADLKKQIDTAKEHVKIIDSRRRAAMASGLEQKGFNLSSSRTAQRTAANKIRQGAKSKSEADKLFETFTKFTQSQNTGNTPATPAKTG